MTTNNPTPGSEMPIPEEIRKWIKDNAKEFCRLPESPPDVTISSREYSLQGLLGWHNGAEAMYRHLSRSKPKEGESGVLRWVNVNDRLPEERFEVYFVRYGKNSRGTLHTKYFKQWNVTHWLDESSPSTGESLEKVMKAQHTSDDTADKYNTSLIEQLKDHLRAKDAEIAQLKADKEYLRKGCEEFQGKVADVSEEAFVYRKALEDLRDQKDLSGLNRNKQLKIASALARYPKPITP
jgi:uncharacterized protein YihD (DUF1040 family)